MTLDHLRSRPAARLGRSFTIAAAASCLLAVSPANAAATELTVSGAWIRTTVPSRPAAGYFTLRNKGDTARALVAADAPACKKLMLHRSVNKNGTDRMIMVHSVEIPAHGSVTFAPGGYHLMCMSPSVDVAPGRSVAVKLRFGDGTSMTRQFKVYGPAGR